MEGHRGRSDDNIKQFEMLYTCARRETLNESKRRGNNTLDSFTFIDPLRSEIRLAAARYHQRQYNQSQCYTTNFSLSFRSAWWMAQLKSVGNDVNKSNYPSTRKRARSSAVYNIALGRRSKSICWWQRAVSRSDKKSPSGKERRGCCWSVKPTRWCDTLRGNIYPSWKGLSPSYLFLYFFSFFPIGVYLELLMHGRYREDTLEYI